MTPSAALDRFFEAWYRRHPVTATFTGVHEHDHRLPDWSPAGLDAAVREMRTLRRDLDAAGRVPDDRVRDVADEIDLALADAVLEIQIAEHESRHFQRGNPALWTGEAIFSIVSLVTRPFAPIDQRLRAAAARLSAIPAFLEDARETIVHGPEAWRDRALRECEAAESLFGRSLPDWLPGSGASSAVAAEAGAACLVARDAFQRFATWLLGLATREPGGYAAGAALISLLLTRGHWCRTPLATLLDEAEAALSSARATLDMRVREVGASSWADAQARIAALRPTPDDYLVRFERAWHRCRDAAIDADLVSWPDAPIRYTTVPSHLRTAAPLLYFLAYRSPAVFDAVPVHDYLVASIDHESPDQVEARLGAAHDAAIVLNHVIHHGGLGHHVQNWYARRAASRIGQVAAIDGASRIAMFPGGSLAEGWACYACDLMEESGALTALERAAQQHTRVRLAARAVVDLSLHTGALRFDQALDAFETRGLMPPAAARAEAVKTSMFPGTAAMYWLGIRALHDLRELCAARDGASFSLRGFHDRLLGYGALPAQLIARLMHPGHLLWPEA
ncbi:MAG: DUF885 family protein [Acidobacteriota bacterium]